MNAARDAPHNLLQHYLRNPLIRSVRPDNWREPRGAGLDHFHVAFAERDRVYEISMAAASAAEPERHLRELLLSLRLLSHAEETALANELLARGHVESFVGSSLFLRDGVIRDRPRGIVWRVPSPSWRVWPLDLGPDEQGSLLSAELRGLDVAVDLEAYDGAPGLEALHDAACDDYAVDSSADEIVVAGARALRSRLVEDGEHVELTSLVAHGVGYTLSTQGAEAAVAAARGQIDALVAGLSFEAPAAEDEAHGPSYVNHRLGFAYRCPMDVESEPYSYEDMPVIAVGRTCGRGETTVGVTGLAVSEGSPELAMRLIEEALRTHFGGRPFERVVRGSVQLGGLPATHLALIGLTRETHIVVGRRDRIVYMLVAD
ncbi:MAG: hypothetical protein K8H88_18620, partial [Sandaracinaceae bacterium]|nr:hypothetical protein [Sandaracinaceae bacterium]